MAVQRKAKGGTDVILHVVQGRPFELEIWTGGYGERPAVNLERLEYYDTMRRDSQ